MKADRYWQERLNQGVLSDAEALQFAEFALGRVSRTFALNIRVLPRPLRDHVLYAYLYCRMADTLEDDPALSSDAKGNLLRKFSLLLPAEGTVFNIEPFLQEFRAQLPLQWNASTQWEHLLLVHAPVVLAPFFKFSDPVRKVVSRCVQEMCLGMANFAGKQEAGADHLIETLSELDNYCYYVAGTVGVLLCDLFIRHSGRIRSERAKSLKALCVSFGLGLQLTNILKDLHSDNERNVSWLPNELLQAEKITFKDFLSPERRSEAKRIYGILLKKARGHLEDALEYSCLIPKWDRRLRLFCLWPLFMAAETLALLAESTETLAQGARLKIPRSRVKDILLKTRLFVWSNRWIRAEFKKPLRRLESALQTLAAPQPSP